MPLQVITWMEAFKRVYKNTECPDCLRGYSGTSVCTRCKGTCSTSGAEVMEFYDHSLRDGRGHKHFVPAVIRNVKQVKQSFRKVNFSRTNVFKRDNFTCQYCGVQDGPGVILEIEHVVPRSKWNGAGSPTCWTNIVTACRPCNRKKADFFLAHSKDQEAESEFHVHMPLCRTINGQKVTYKRPTAPKQGQFSLAIDFKNMKRIPEEWLPYIQHLL